MSERFRFYPFKEARIYRAERFLTKFNPDAGKYWVSTKPFSVCDIRPGYCDEIQDPERDWLIIDKKTGDLAVFSDDQIRWFFATRGSLESAIEQAKKSLRRNQGYYPFYFHKDGNEVLFWLMEQKFGERAQWHGIIIERNKRRTWYKLTLKKADKNK